MNHHYYGATCYTWVVANTKAKVLKMLAADAGSSILQRARKRAGGLECTVCRVPLPQAAHYTIREYMPHTITKEDGVNSKRAGEIIQLEEVENLRITTMSGTAIPRLPDEE